MGKVQFRMKSLYTKYIVISQYFSGLFEVDASDIQGNLK